MTHEASMRRSFQEMRQLKVSECVVQQVKESQRIEGIRQAEI